MMQGAGSARDESWEDGMNRRRGESWARCNGPTRGAVCLCEVTQADLWIAEMAELIERNQAELRALYLHSLLAENKCEVPGCETCGGPDKIERFDPSIDLCDPDKRAAHFAKLDGLEYATSAPAPTPVTPFRARLSELAAALGTPYTMRLRGGVDSEVELGRNETGHLTITVFA